LDPTEIYRLPLPNDEWCLVDRAVWEKTHQYRWSRTKSGHVGRKVGRRYVYLHRIVCAAALAAAPPGTQVHHTGHADPRIAMLDNRRASLQLISLPDHVRLTTALQGPKFGGEWKGVCYLPRQNRWRAYIQYRGRTRYHTCRTLAEALAWRDDRVVEYYGLGNAYLNQPERYGLPAALPVAA
jgi:hypothetical protein